MYVDVNNHVRPEGTSAPSPGTRMSSSPPHCLAPRPCGSPPPPTIPRPFPLPVHVSLPPVARSHAPFLLEMRMALCVRALRGREGGRPGIFLGEGGRGVRRGIPLQGYRGQCRRSCALTTAVTHAWRTGSHRERAATWCAPVGERTAQALKAHKPRKGKPARAQGWVHVNVLSLGLSRTRLRSNWYTQPYGTCPCYKMCLLCATAEYTCCSSVAQ